MQSNVNLKPFNTMGVEATARVMTTAEDVESLKNAIAFAKAENLPIFILGEGANLLIATRMLNRVVIKMAIKGFEVVGESTTHTFIEVGAGDNWHETVRKTITQGWAGLENLALIPSSVGASVVQNIGAYGSEVSQFVKEVLVYDPATDETMTLKHNECDFSYRHSIFKTHKAKDWIVLSVTFALPKEWQPNLSYKELAKRFENVTPTAFEIFDAVVDIRSKRLPDPKDLGSAGSFFKNPMVTREVFSKLLDEFPSIVHYPMGNGMEKLAAGWLIDQAGFRGKREGDAGTYEKQALVLVNHGDATGQELWLYSQRIERGVYAQFGVHLEPEPVILFD